MGLTLFSFGFSVNATSLKAIQSTSIPPINKRPGIFNNQTATKVASVRIIIAPTVPKKIAFFCCFFRKFLAIKPITIALSPAITKSMMTIDNKAEKKTPMYSPQFVLKANCVQRLIII